MAMKRIGKVSDIPLRPVLLALGLVLLLSACAHVGGKEAEVMTTEERISLASIYESKGKTGLALREYTKAAEQGGSARAWFAIGNIHLREGRYDEAERSYLRAVKINPSNGSYRNNLAWAYMQKGELDDAENAVRKALLLDADRRFAYLDTLGAIQIKQGDLDGAEATLTEAVRLAPATEREGRVEIYTHLAELYRQKGDIGRAVRMEERARALGARAR